MNARESIESPIAYEVPRTEADLLRLIQSWEWRICSGFLYKIVLKQEDGLDGITAPFRPNDAQKLLLSNLHNRNIILKARQLGFSTLIEILALDYALFNSDSTVVVIAHTAEAAEELFRSKIRFAYEHLPEALRRVMPLEKETQSQLIFAHNRSTIRVVTSARSGTAQFLHVSEFGKIAAKFPEKAREIVTGSLQVVPTSGFVFIESTAEGQSGPFYQMSRLAEAHQQAGKNLTSTDYRFHFFAWWQESSYRLPMDEAMRVPISATDHEYFDFVQDVMATSIDIDQRAWYVSKRDTEFVAEPALMWREFPSTPDECWRSSTEGKYLAKVLARARATGRIGKYPIISHVPVNTFWDLGASDDTAVWLHQQVGGMNRFVAYRESRGEGYLADILWLESLGVVWGSHYLPHDASHTEKGIERVTSPVSRLREIRPSWDWQVVPRVRTIQHGIDLMRQEFESYEFDEVGCKEGLSRLEAYTREWNTRLQDWADYPRHDDASHAADALRQKSQAFENTRLTRRKPGKRERVSGWLA